MRTGDMPGASGESTRSMKGTRVHRYAKVLRLAHARPDRTVISRIAIALTAWTERWVPDAFIFALLATVIVFAAALGATASSLVQVVDAWGRGFWELIPFTLQMSLVIITGHVLATSQPMGRVIRTIAGWPTTPRGAVALVTFI